MRKVRSPLERFLDKVAVQPDGCWLWQGSTVTGYGQLWVDGKNQLAHRFSHENFTRPIPEGFQVDHLCRTPLCVNPNHLEAVSPSVNVRRSTAPGVSSARQLSKTHCPQGHLYDRANTYRHDNRRHCRACRSARSRAYRARIKEAS